MVNQWDELRKQVHSRVINRIVAKLGNVMKLGGRFYVTCGVDLDGLAPKDFSNSCECVIEEDLPCTCRSCLLYYANLVRTRAELECRGEEEEEEDDCDVCSVGKLGLNHFTGTSLLCVSRKLRNLQLGTCGDDDDGDMCRLLLVVKVSNVTGFTRRKAPERAGAGGVIWISQE